MRGGGDHHGALDVFVQVAAADAAPFYGYEDLGGVGGWFGDLVEADVGGAVVAGCSHVWGFGGGVCGWIG